MPPQRSGVWSSLRVRMALSYVGVTVASVLLLELLAFGVAVLLFLNVGALTRRVAQTAERDARNVAAVANGSLRRLPPGFALGDPRSSPQPNQITFGATGVQVPQVQAALPAAQPVALAVCRREN